MSSVVPDGWITSNLDLVTKTVFSNVDKKSYADETPVLLCNYMDVYGNSYITKSIEFMPATAKQREIDKFSLEYDDVMITKDSETPQDIAVPAYVSEQLEGVLCGYHLALIRTDKQKLSGGFLSHLLSLDSIQRRFYRLANGSTRFGLTAESINKAELTIPPLPEQKKIASILTSVDEVIENTQKQIDKLQDLKKATMNELLTKGIGHTEFKDSELGRIPKSWEVVPIDECLEHFQNGFAFSSSGYQEAGIPIISIVNISLDGKFKFDTKKEKKWSPSELEKLQRYQVKNNDLIIAMTDVTPNMAIIGRGAVVNRKLVSLLNQRVGLLKPKERVLSKYLAYVFNGQYWRKSAQLSSSLGAQANLGTADILRLRVLLPPIEEQKTICAILSSLDEMSDVKNKRISQTQSLKKSLMQDLLTGKVRVTVN
jgi:type I restriction enzyme S subunit